MRSAIGINNTVAEEMRGRNDFDPWDPTFRMLVVPVQHVSRAMRGDSDSLRVRLRDGWRYGLMQLDVRNPWRLRRRYHGGDWRMQHVHMILRWNPAFWGHVDWTCPLSVSIMILDGRLRELDSR